MFNTVEITAQDADTVLETLQTLPWLSSRADDYPRLLVTSREHAAYRTLKKVDLGEHWDE